MKNAFLIASAFLLLSIPFSLFSQTPHPIVHCLTMENDSAMRQQLGIGTIDDFESWLAPLVERQKHELATATRNVVSLPIVFHVIHDGEAVGSGDNLAASYINAQIDQLNHDFRRTPGTSGFNNNPVGADTEIAFCPATVDPSGNSMAEPGINRIDRNMMGWTAPPYATCPFFFLLNTDYIDNTIKPQSQWDPDQYINIWVMDLNCGLLGYAQFPSASGLGGMPANGGPANNDGVVIRTASVGSTSLPNPSPSTFARGRTLTHEIGHFFGLRHIWGDANCGNDFCADTPTQAGSSNGCPNTTTCDGVNDMVENYMDYSDDACMNL
ncbi:MAG: M43 family zinc metalloprotease, partial [Bacteroidota bacterium]